MPLPDSLLDKYRASLTARAAELRAARAARNPAEIETLRKVAHRLSGTGASYGFPEISRSARRVETARTEDLPAAVEDLLTAIDRVTAPAVAPSPRAAHAPDPGEPTPSSAP